MGFLRHHRVIDDARVADGARRRNPLFLGAVEQGGVKLGIDLHVARQAHHVLLGARQVPDAAVEIRQLLFHPADLGLGGDHFRMGAFQILILLLELLFELYPQGFHFG